MRILIMNWRDPKHPRSGGAEIVTLEHARRWVKSGHSVTWLSASFQGALREEVIKGVRITRRGGSLTVYVIAPFFYLWHAREFSFMVDEIHGVPFFTPLYSRKPKVAFIHEIAKEIWDYAYPFPLNIMGRILERIYFFLYRNTWFWTDAPSTVDELVQHGVDRNRCIAIPCPVSNHVLSTLPKKRNRPTILYVSRLEKMKGIEDILRAFSIIQQSLPAATLWIVGDGYRGYVEKLKNQVREMGLSNRLTFFGRVSDRRKLTLMQQSHVLLHASIREGWGLVVLEAASQGTPSVVYNVPGLRDVTRQGKAGVVVSNNTPQALAQETLALLSNARRYHAVQKNALAWVRSLHWDDVAERSLALIKRIANKKL